MEGTTPATSPEPKRPDRFYSLDVLRGVAALSVVFFHWEHFFYAGTTWNKFSVKNLPLADWIAVLYTKGWLAVDLFFCLSGFIFYWLYSRSVSEGIIGPAKFAVLRFSRLYPLHLVTLLFVALCQKFLIDTNGSYFVFAFNDSKHFLLNLFFASSWGLEGGYSFNGPSWSVSVEILLYALFFVLCRLFPIHTVVLASASIVGFVVISKFYNPVGRGIGSFFLGGCERWPRLFEQHSRFIRGVRAG